MAVTKIKTTSSFTNLTKYDSFLAGNAAYSPSSYESIASVNPSGVSSLTFSSIPSTYQHLQIRSISRLTRSDTAGLASFRLTANGDTSANYTYHWLEGDGTSVASFGNTGLNFTIPARTPCSLNANMYGVSIIDIDDYISTTKNKTMRFFSGTNQNTTEAGEQRVTLGSGLWISTSAISSITITSSESTFRANTSFALYGIKA